jgi:nitrogen-specific signal transduction histidine kinase/CHASE3 domain sensor protein
MKSTYIYKSSLVIKIALGTAILLIIYITSIFFTQMQNLGHSVDSMSISSKRLLALEKILSVISVNESSVRSYIISGDSVYLQKRFYSKESLFPQMESLRKLSDKSITSFNCDSLQRMIDARYDLFKSTLVTAGKTPANKAEINFLLAQNDTLTDNIRNYIYKSLEAESANVDQYLIDHRYEIETSIITSFLLVTVALFILLISISRISSDLSSMKKMNDELKFLNYTFNNAEKIAGISHWKYNLQTKKYSFSDNFYNMIGLDPDTFEPTLESILPYLHPDDRENVIQAYSDSIVNRTPTSMIFRMYSKNNGMKYFKSVGSFAENSKGELVKIGVNYDITEHHQNTADLEESNRDLRAINAELESFNNIVSHDLQEPLRKIQMFISRIEENEFPALSETGQEQFKRIASSANRMQNLLIDLVNYSRAMKGDKAFAETDLGKIVKEVFTELSLNIEEKKAVIKVGPLPIINAIPAQIHQLFVNLLTNSIKFTQPDTPPKVAISQEEIAENEVCNGESISDKKYIKIAVVDKGIGFSQEFADKIFLLFRRLEKERYDGTGIGLAICKKIVENHNGYIHAESDLGKGAKFIIYLPK